MGSAEDRASLEATRWLVDLQEKPGDAALRQRFELWRNASLLNEAAWEETAELSDIAVGIEPAYSHVWSPIVDARPRPQSRAIATKVTRRRHILAARWRSLVAASALAACLAYFVVPGIVQRLEADHATAAAEMRSVVLEDGSEVELAPSSAIAVAYSAEERKIRLLSGEAFFKVTPQNARPFKVAAGFAEAIVVGTSFDVRRDADAVTVSVEQGVVRVGPAGARDELTAGDVVRVGRDGQAVRSWTPPAMVASWRNGQLVARNTPLRQAVDQLRRYWQGTIILTSSDLGERRVTGAYNLADPEDALKAIAHAHGGKVRRITPWILVVSDG